MQVFTKICLQQNIYTNIFASFTLQSNNSKLPWGKISAMLFKTLSTHFTFCKVWISASYHPETTLDQNTSNWHVGEWQTEMLKLRGVTKISMMYLSLSSSNSKVWSWYFPCTSTTPMLVCHFNTQLTLHEMFSGY